MFAVDDELEASAKHEALDELPPERRSRAFEAWLRLGAACRKRGNGGLVTSALLSKILHSWKPAERARAAQDLVDARGGRSAGLWVVEGDGYRFHEWERWNPSAEEAEVERASLSAEAIRSRRYRMNKKAGKRDGQRDDDRDAERDASRPNVTPDRDAERDGQRDDDRDVSSSRARSAGAPPRARVRDPIPVPLPVPSQRSDLRSSREEPRHAEMACGAWTRVLAERGRAFQPDPAKDAGRFRAIGQLVDATRGDVALTDALEAAARRHLDGRRTGTTPEYWLGWLQREASHAPQTERNGVSPIEDFDPDPLPGAST